MASNLYKKVKIRERLRVVASDAGIYCDLVATGRKNRLERRALLKEISIRGIRLTRQRRALIETLQEAQEHIDAVSLLKLARKREPGINRATVYRTLDLLKSLGLIDELDLMHLEGEKHFYEARTRSDHLHLACLQCGVIIEYTSPAFRRLKDEIARETKFQIGVIRLEVGGLCKGCRQEPVKS